MVQKQNDENRSLVIEIISIYKSRIGYKRAASLQKNVLLVSFAYFLSNFSTYLFFSF